uniref:TBC1 domain family member 22B-like n=1 Tax=Sinocyclocheilus anshuiensis TaxID=1608454 RepID=A0A671R6D4_9TELE
MTVIMDFLSMCSTSTLIAPCVDTVNSRHARSNFCRDYTDVIKCYDAQCENDLSKSPRFNASNKHTITFYSDAQCLDSMIKHWGKINSPMHSDSSLYMLIKAVFSLLSEVGIEQAVLHRQQSLPHRPVIPLVARIADQNTSGTPAMTQREASRLDKFRQVLAGPNTDLEELRKLSWSGIPRQVRPITWKLLSGYLPANAERRESTLQRKRQEYFGFIEQYYDSRNDEHHQDTYRQIHIDIPRTNPLIPLFQQASVQEIFERILFIWAIRHPASGYVQGINDLVTPFFVVYVFEYIEEEVENFNVSSLQEEVLQNIEADSFWCMSKLLDGIQDNYTFAQPGIQRKVKALEELVSRLDETVHRHMQQYEVEYLQFAFRWMNNLLMRELPLRCTIRLWDTYQAEPEGFSHFHLYVCAAFLVRWRKEILEEKDFQGLMILLQNLPTMHWGNEEVSVLLAEAYRLKFAFADAPNHYKR